ncbi:S24 family peptidase [Fibrella aestuarina]|uniref:S24 family peptidase n=1 Tax=Fibrella aestuarina TaxID=651143 RepID=UPI000688F924|nr:S24 family peptidase [Fibrella aestuarina]
MTNEKEWFKPGELVRATVEHRHLIPLLLSHVHAGFPSPADNYIEKVLSLDELCIVHPEATYFYRVADDCMVDERIYEGDILIVDCAIDNSPGYLHGKVVVAWIDGEYVVRRLCIKRRWLS